VTGVQTCALPICHTFERDPVKRLRTLPFRGAEFARDLRAGGSRFELALDAPRPWRGRSLRSSMCPGGIGRCAEALDYCGGLTRFSPCRVWVVAPAWPAVLGYNSSPDD